VRQLLATCSTPLGVTAVGTPLFVEVPVTAQEACSTPLGVTAVGTESFAPPGADSPGAQRLSASLRSALLSQRRIMACQICATPLGVPAVGTRCEADTPRAAGGAQRLSASLRSAPPRGPSWTWRPTGAQRLSASLRSAPLKCQTTRREQLISPPFTDSRSAVS